MYIFTFICVSITDYIYNYIYPNIAGKKVSFSQPVCVVNMNIMAMIIYIYYIPPILQFCPEPKSSFIPFKRICRNNPPVSKKRQGKEPYRTKEPEKGRNC